MNRAHTARSQLPLPTDRRRRRSQAAPPWPRLYVSMLSRNSASRHEDRSGRWLQTRPRGSHHSLDPARAWDKGRTRTRNAGSVLYTAIPAEGKENKKGEGTPLMSNPRGLA